VKKIFVTLAAVLFVLSFAVSAFAIHAEIPAETQSVVAKGATQITLGGEIRFRGWYNNNLGTPHSSAVTGVPQDGNSKGYYDGRVRLNVDAQVTPNVQGYVQLETATSSDVYTWGNFNSKPTTMSILQAWILYKGTGLFGFNSGLKVGHMPLKLSEGQFFDHTKFGDDAIVFFMDPNKQVHIGLLTIKFSEALSGDNTDDTDGYVGLMTYKINDKNTVGLNYTYLNNSDADFDLSNLGLHANGNISGIGYKAEVDFQFGDIGKSPSDADFSGWALMLAGNYKMDPVNLRASFAYGSGDNDAFDDNIDQFQTFVSNNHNYTFVYDYRATTTAGAIGTGIANTTYYNLGIDYAASKDINLSLDGYILRASKTGALEDVLGRNVSKNAGWEVDAAVKYNVAKNLTYGVTLGYFKSGSFYEDVYGNDKEGATVLNNVLTLSF
jgi:hypothetical protein